MTEEAELEIIFPKWTLDDSYSIARCIVLLDVIMSIRSILAINKVWSTTV